MNICKQATCNRNGLDFCESLFCAREQTLFKTMRTLFGDCYKMSSMNSKAGPSIGSNVNQGC